MEDAFLHGKTDEHLRNIDGTLHDLKEGMKAHNASDVIAFEKINDKMDSVADLARNVADHLADKVEEQQGFVEARHQENIKRMDTLDEKLETISKQLVAVNSKVTTIYAFSAGIGFVASFAATWFKDKILKS